MQKLETKASKINCLVWALVLLSLAGAGRPISAAPVTAVTRVLPNGITLVTRVDRTAPRIAISLQVRVGAADETMETAGWRRLLTEAMLRAAATGTPGNGATSSTPAVALSELQRQAEAAGGRLGAGVGDDVIEFWAVGDSSSAGHLLDLLLNVVQQPRLSDKDIDIARQRMQTRLDNGSDDVSQQAVMALRSRLYRDARGDLTAYGLPDNGTDDSLKALTAPKLRALWTQYFQPARFVVAVTGDLSVARLQARLTQIAVPTAASTAEAEPYFAQPSAGQPDLVVRQSALLAPAAWVFISYNVAGLKDADQPALRVLAAALGESSLARLPQRLLSGRPIPHSPHVSAAQVAIQYSPRRYGSEMIAFAQTDVQNVENVKNAILDEIRKLRDAPLDARELERAKNYVNGNWAVEREGLRERAFQTAFSPALGAAPDTDWPHRIATVTAADVRRVAGKYLQAHAVALILPEQ